MPSDDNSKPIANPDDSAYFRLLVDNSPDRILTLDPEGTILFINHALVNLSTEELIGTDVMSYVEEHERAAYGEALDDVFSNGVSRSLELSTAGLTSSFTRLIPIKHDDVVETVLVIATDLSEHERKNTEEERKKFETQVRHAQKLESLAVLTEGIAHDFNNLLTGILGSASLASSKLPEGSAAEEQIDRILQAAEKAAVLTNQMLAYAGKENFEVGFVDLNQLVGDVIPLVRTAISKSTRIRESWAANLPSIEADPVQLRQVVVALVTNASEALQDEHGEVSIRTGALKSTDHSGTRVFIEIADTGLGMDADTSKRALDIFVERASEIDAVLLDVSMPRMSGEQTLVKLRRMRPHVKILLTSGHSEQVVLQTFEGKKASAFIQKPFRASELVDRIQQVVNPRL